MVSTFAAAPEGTVASLAMDGNGNIYAADNSSNTNIYEFSPGGSLLKTFNNPNAAGLYGVAVDAQGNIFSSDASAGKIYENNANLTPLYQYSTPKGICFESNGSLLMADANHNQIFLLNPNTGYTESLLTGGGGSSNPFQAGFQDGILAVALFNQPTGIKIGSDGTIYVADLGNYAIRKISP